MNAKKIPGQALTEFDIHLMGEGSHYQSFEKLGAHLVETGKIRGTTFAVWAPNAKSVAVIGDFNNWDPSANPLELVGQSGIWEGFVKGAEVGHCYKFRVYGATGGEPVDKLDPYAFESEIPPRTASRIWDVNRYQWSDQKWMEERKNKNTLEEPMLIYELHLGSWRHNEYNGWLTYREIAALLPNYLNEMGFTHVEFMPVTEHPFYASWGYQTTGYFAPTSRYGSPDDFKFLVDKLHQAGVSVMLDWVPAHFPIDEVALGNYDGTHLYEHADARQGFHQEWGTYIFNHGRNEVSNFLISSALFWLEKYHIDGLRIDAVASMLYLDYAREPGEWIPNKDGGRENLEAAAFLQHLNETIYGRFPGTYTIAEESTSWPMVSRPVYSGGLGFGLKWNMGWMNDTLKYFSFDPVYRAANHNKLTFGLMYAFSENFVLPFSHDEVVHCKSSLIGKMPGDDWQKFANLRVMLGYMYGHPGKKLLFMGAEIAQWDEWNFDKSLDWHLLEFAPHQGIQRWVKDLNHFVRNEPALYQVDFEHAGFEWVDCEDASQSTLSFLRFDKERKTVLLVLCNFTPVPRHDYRVGAPFEGEWCEVLNSDSEYYGGSGLGNLGKVQTEQVEFHSRPFSLNVTLPPLSVVMLKHYI